jgi:hypothetical protein
MPPMSRAAAPTTRHAALLVLLATAAAAGIALGAEGMMGRVLEMRVTATSATTVSDTIRGAPMLVLVAAPIVVVSASWLLLAPGLLLTTAWLRSDTLGHWLGMGLAISLVVVSAAVEIAEFVVGGAITGSGFIALVLATAIGAGLVAIARPQHRWTGRAADDRWAAQALPMVVLMMALVIGLFPKFFFEAFNGDGAHTYEATRLLLFRAVAFFGDSAGGISGFPGPNSVLFTYPGAWFMRLFGETEASVRLPVLLYLAVLGPVLLTAASVGGRRPRAVHAWLVAGSLAVFAVVQAFSATYDPYAADIALPATQDTLFLALFLSIVTATFEHRLGAIWLLTVLAVLCSQAAVALTVFWLAARWIADREARPLVPAQAVAFVAGVVGANLLVRLVAVLGVPAPGGEHGLLDLLRKFVVLQFTDVRRLLFVVVPVGLYPVLALPALRRRTPSVDALALLLAASFGLYYVMAYYSLHYFVPAMIVCLLLFWRTELAGGPPRPAWFPPVAAAMVAAALYVSLPVEAGIYTATRDIGRRLDVSAITGYETAQNTAWAHLDDLSALFPKDMDPAVPDAAYGGSPLAFHIYAQQARTLDAPRDYAFGPDASGVWRPTILNDAAYARDRVLQPGGSRGSRLYDIPRDLLFGRGTAHAGVPVLDFTPLARRLLAYAQSIRP